VVPSALFTWIDIVAFETAALLLSKTRPNIMTEIPWFVCVVLREACRNIFLAAWTEIAKAKEHPRGVHLKLWGRTPVNNLHETAQ